MPQNIAVYGLGHVGLPLAVVLYRAGFDVLGIDPAPQIPPQVERGIKPQELQALTCFSDPQPADVSFVVVPTPSLPSGDFDHAYVERCLEQIEEMNEPGHVVSLISTVSPGSCRVLQNMHEGIKLVYNPTFIALGNVVNGLVRPDLLMIACPDLGAQADVGSLWSQVFRTQQHTHDTPTYYHFANQYEEVELLKLSVNAALGMKISLANSLGQLFEAYDVDPAAVAVMANDPRIGKGYLLPGSPITGPCLPRDNVALLHAARAVKLNLPISEATLEIQSDWYRNLMADIISTDPKSLGILGMAYKEGLDVDTASVGSVLIEALDIPTKIYDELIPSDDYDDVLACDVIVVTRRDLMPGQCAGRVIRLW